MVIFKIASNSVPKSKQTVKEGEGKSEKMVPAASPDNKLLFFPVIHIMKEKQLLKAGY